MIELQEVGKTYRGGSLLDRAPVHALDGVTLSVRPGESIAIVGLNGAGKSTLLRILMGYARPTSGIATIGGLLPRSYAEAHGIAYIPERVTLPPHWTVEGALRALAMFGGIGENAWDRVAEAIERLGLTPIVDRKVAALSKGNLQRLAIAQTLLADRKLMVLDEPTDGLDPVWIVGLRSILSEWRAADSERVVVLASHNLAEVERLADRVILLHNGALRDELAPGAPAGLLEAEFLRRLRGLEEGRP